MKINKNELKRLIVENLKKSKEFKNLNERFVPSGPPRKLSPEETQGGKVSHGVFGKLFPTNWAELKGVDPSREPEFEKNPALFDDYGEEASIKTMLYKDPKTGLKTHRPKITPEDVKGLSGLQYPEGFTSQQLNAELGNKSREAFKPYDEGGTGYTADMSTDRQPGKLKRKNAAADKLENVQIKIQEIIVGLEGKASSSEEDANRIEYLKQMYADINDVIELIDSIKI